MMTNKYFYEKKEVSYEFLKETLLRTDVTPIKRRHNNYFNELLEELSYKGTFNLKDEIARLDSAGIVHAMRSTKDLDEAPSAYKDIDEVIACELDLIRPIVKLKPIAVIKG